jgi:hypothetical protein
MPCSCPREAERRDRKSFYHTAITDQSRRFTFQTLTPGEYKVYRWEASDFGAWMDADFVRSPVPNPSRSIRSPIKSAGDST